jgi:hypothetical protein
MPTDPRGLTDYIRETATKYGVDPEVAVRVAQSEGLRDPIGDNGKSFGAFQLYTGGGLGNEFKRDTGLDPGDPQNERATIDYALKRASQMGWGPWHGAARVGIDQWEGIGGGQGTGADAAVFKAGGGAIGAPGGTAPAGTPGPAVAGLLPQLGGAAPMAGRALGALGNLAGGGGQMPQPPAPSFLALGALPQMPQPYFAPRIQPFQPRQLAQLPQRGRVG